MMSHRHCREYAAVAGAGLPAIEPGMPDPAGTGLSRRTFLVRAAGMAIAVYGGGRLAPEALQEGIAAAAEGPAKPVLVNVLMSGGLDSIGVLGPYGSGRLQQLRPTLHEPTNERNPLTFAPNSSWFWHPDAEVLRRLHLSGRLVVIPSVGYTDPNQSHFTSRHFWEVGATDVLARTGWMGRYLDSPGVGDPLNPLQGLTVGTSLVPSLASGTMPVAAVEMPDNYVFRSEGVWREDLEPAMHDALAAIAKAPSNGDPVLAQARAAQANASNLQSRLSTLPDIAGNVAYPPVQFGQRLKTLAHMLEQGMPIRVAGLIANGDFDTHAGQATGFTAHLPNALGALEAFQDDLEARGIADRVITLVWSEFGRRPEENGSAGTDHGASAIAFVMGKRENLLGYAAGSRDGLLGPLPNIAANALDEHGNIRHALDFRDVYGSLLHQWLGADVDAIVTGPGGRAVETDLELLA